MRVGAKSLPILRIEARLALCRKSVVGVIKNGGTGQIIPS